MLAAALALGLVLLIGSGIRLALPPADLPEPFGDQHQDAETLIFVLAFAVVLPLAVVLVPRLADRIATGPSSGVLPAIAMGAAGSLVASLLFVKLSEILPWGGGLDMLGVVMVLWCAAVAAVMAGAVGRRTPAIGGLGPAWLRLDGIAGALLVLGFATALVALAFAHLSSIAIAPLVVCLSLEAAVLVRRERGWAPWARRAHPRVGVAIDIGVVALIVLAVPNLVVFTPGDPATALQTTVIHFHQNFFLGPANQILAGDAMLVETLSQYGVGSIYLLAAWFQLAPIGGGTLGLIEGLLSAATFASGYFVLRVAGVSRPLSAAALAVAVVVLVYGLAFPLGALLQHGALRFGLPMAVIAAAVVESRWTGTRWGLAARGLQAAIVGLASIWSLEAFAYTVLTVLAILTLQAALLPSEERRGRLLRRLAELLGACLVAHLLLVAITLVAAGELPDWGWYLNTLREFLVGEVGDLTYDFSSWSPGLGVGALYLVSAISLALLVRWRRDVALRGSTAMIAIAGMTAYGVALLSYLVNRSADHIIPYVCLPAVLVAALWLSLLQRPELGASARLRRGLAAAALGVAALMVAVAWSSVDTRFSQSALALARPGGASLSGALERLWNPPPLSPGAIEGERLLEQYLPGQRRSIVLTSADLGTEVLLRSGRASAIPFGDAWEDSIVPNQHLAPLGEFVASLRLGQRLLVDDAALEVFDAYLRDPGRDPLTDPVGATSIVPGGLAPLQEWVLKEMGQQYRMDVIARAEPRLAVVELVPAGSS